MTRIFTAIICLVLLIGCETTKVSPKAISEDKSGSILERGYKTFRVELDSPRTLKKIDAYGKATSLPKRTERYHSVIEQVIIEKFEALGLIYDPDNYDLDIYYNPVLYSEREIGGKSETAGWIQIFAGDPKTREEIFNLRGDILSVGLISTSLCKTSTERILNILEVFQPVAGGDATRWRS